MKKNKTLRFAVCLFILCLLTTCVIGTTLAKYTTGGEASDQARVAKWGVTVSIQADNLFKTEYEKTDTNYSGSLSVKSSSTDNTNVVAPGTDSSQANGSAVFSISGTPEVATRIEITLTEVKDVVLKAGEYSDPTTSKAGEKFTLAQDYYPVVFTLVQVEDENGPCHKNEITGTLAVIKAALDKISGATYAPNINLTSKYELSWEWKIEGGNDKADTYLGNLQAGHDPDTLTTDKYCLDVSYKLSITVTQID